jgi:hypothetical protein
MYVRTAGAYILVVCGNLSCQDYGYPINIITGLDASLVEDIIAHWSYASERAEADHCSLCGELGTPIPAEDLAQVLRTGFLDNRV